MWKAIQNSLSTAFSCVLGLTTPFIFSFNSGGSILYQTPKYIFMAFMLSLILFTNFETFLKNLSKFKILIAAFFIVLIHQTVILPENGFNFLGPDGQESGLITYFICLVILLLYHSRKVDKYIAYSIALGSSGAALLTTLQTHGVNLLENVYGSMNDIGTTGFHAWLVPLGIAILYMFFSFNSLWQKIGFGIAFCIIMSASQSKIFILGFISLATLLCIFYAFRKHTKHVLEVGVLIIFSLTSFWTYRATVNFDVGSVIGSSATNTVGRLNIYKAALDVAEHSPFFGSGFSSFYLHWYDWSDSSTARSIVCHEFKWHCVGTKIRQYGNVFINDREQKIQIVSINHPHNEIIHILNAGGIFYIGILIYILIVYRRYLIPDGINFKWVILILIVLYAMSWTLQLPQMCLLVLAICIKPMMEVAKPGLNDSSNAI